MRRRNRRRAADGEHAAGDGVLNTVGATLAGSIEVVGEEEPFHRGYLYGSDGAPNPPLPHWTGPHVDDLPSGGGRTVGRATPQ